MINIRFYKNNYSRTEYARVVAWCNQNNCTIEDKGDYYEVVALPEPEPVSIDEQYSARVVELIREKYSQDDENSILRKKLAGLDDEGFEEYNTYCEACKILAKSELGLLPSEGESAEEESESTEEESETAE